MICPQCKEQGKKSTITIEGREAFEWFDEDGRWHFFDNFGPGGADDDKTACRCSNGHILIVANNQLDYECRRTKLGYTDVAETTPQDHSTPS